MIENWIILDYSAYKTKINLLGGDRLVHFNTLRYEEITPGQFDSVPYLSVAKMNHDRQVYASEIKLDLNPASDYSQYRTDYILTGYSTAVTNSIDAEAELNDLVLQGYKTYVDQTFTEDIEIDINADLGRNSSTGFLANDGPGQIIVEISEDGAIYGDDIPLKNTETLTWDGISFKNGIKSIKISHSGTDSAYRILAI